MQCPLWPVTLDRKVVFAAGSRRGDAALVGTHARRGLPHNRASCLFNESLAGASITKTRRSETVDVVLRPKKCLLIWAGTTNSWCLTPFPLYLKSTSSSTGPLYLKSTPPIDAALPAHSSKIMAEPRKKANNDGASPATPSKGSRLADKLNKLFLLCTEMKNDTGGAEDYEKTLEENATLRSTLKEREEEVNGLKVDAGKLQCWVDNSINKFGKKFAELDAKVEEGENSKRILVETREKLDKTNQELMRLKAKYNQLEKKVHDEENARKRAEEDLEDEQQQCTILEHQLKVMQKTISLYGEDRLTERDPAEMYANPAKSSSVLADLEQGGFVQELRPQVPPGGDGVLSRLRCTTGMSDAGELCSCFMLTGRRKTSIRSKHTWRTVLADWGRNFRCQIRQVDPRD